MCDRDKELYKLNKENIDAISAPKYQVLSSNKTLSKPEKNHHDLEINTREMIQNQFQRLVAIAHIKAKAGRKQTS